jgi:LacI family transcriptional regulator, repressor for deo operon, udp, cdd, tsx, nupC, and nupG
VPHGTHRREVAAGGGQTCVASASAGGAYGPSVVDAHVKGLPCRAVNVPRDPTTAASRRPRRASILDVAALAGVSASTVSRSLRGHSSISAATRQRVLEAAQELSYSASPQASGLASGRTRTIGIVVPFVTRWFFVNVVAGAYEVLHEAGYDVLLYHLGTGEARDRFFERMPLARRVDAVLTLTLPLTDEHTLALRALDMPLVTLGAVLPGVPCVRIDDVAAVRTGVHHLLHQGHEQIVMIAGVDDEYGFGFAASQRRREGYRRAMEAAGLGREVDVVSADSYGIEGGARAMAALMDRPTLPTAVVAEYDELAIGAMRTLRRASIAVPGRLSVVGVDDHEMASVVDLTTVAQPVQEQGAVAARLLLDTLGEIDGAGPTEVVLPTRLVVRGSTGTPFTRST